MTDLSTLPGTLAHVWAALAEGVARGDAPCRTAVLATADPGGGGDGRIVVLRRADRDSATVELHSDSRAAKVAQLQANPLGTLVFWLPGAGLQIRLRAGFAPLDAATSAERWAAIPQGPRRAYGGTPPPGAPIATPEAHDNTAEPHLFTALSGRIETIDTLHLGNRHRRALFRRADGFAGGWIAP